MHGVLEFLYVTITLLLLLNLQSSSHICSEG